MSNVWQVQDAKARFSELLETSLAEGPQIVSKRGVEIAVLVPIEQVAPVPENDEAEPQGVAARARAAHRRADATASRIPPTRPALQFE